MNLRITRVPGRSGRARWLAGVVLAGAVTASILTATASADCGGPCVPGVADETIYVAVRSLTVTPNVFSMCTAGTPLNFPNGLCESAPITITNGGAGGRIEVSGGNAVPSDQVTNWSLCGAGGNSCTGTPVCTTAPGGLQLCGAAPPGVDQFEQSTGNAGGFAGPNLAPGLACDTAFDSAGGCVSSPGQVGTESVDLTGPTSSTDQSSTFSTVVTWVAAPPS
jgi:hypothetical protein